MTVKTTDQAGFSLLETLVTLAILSISSVLIFQSLASQANLTARIEAAATNATSDAVKREGFTSVVQGLVPSWPEDDETPFDATPEKVSGLTASPLLNESFGLIYFTFELSGNPSELAYIANGRRVVLETFSEAAAFSYLGPDDEWYPEWPPALKQPDAGRFDDSPAYETWPLPRAIRIRSASQSDLDWIANLNWQAPRLPRRQDIEDD